MYTKIEAIEYFLGQSTKSDSFLDSLPGLCPFCNNNITPNFKNAYKKDQNLQVVFNCPSDTCNKLFIAYYECKSPTNVGLVQYNCKYLKSSIGNIRRKEFSEDLANISPTFTEIYNDAIAAESYDLNHIIGIGLRKALEFLIKDYLIHKNPEHQEQILKKMLGPCIKEYIANPNIKNMAERAVWLGNDHTHYVKKWEDKDIKDLKILIDLTLHWIEMEMLTAKYENEM